MSDLVILPHCASSMRNIHTFLVERAKNQNFQRAKSWLLSEPGKSSKAQMEVFLYKLSISFQYITLFGI